MAVTVFTNGYVLLNAVDYSNKGTEVNLPFSIAELNATTFSNTTEIHEPGLKSFSATVKFFSDLADNALDESMYDLWNARTKFAVKLRADAGVIGVANPEWQFTAFAKGWVPLSGKVGDLLVSTLELSNTTAITRAVA